MSCIVVHSMLMVSSSSPSVAQLCHAVLSDSTVTGFSESLLILTSSYQNLRSVCSLLLNFVFRSNHIFVL